MDIAHLFDISLTNLSLLPLVLIYWRTPQVESYKVNTDGCIKDRFASGRGLLGIHQVIVFAPSSLHMPEQVDYIQGGQRQQNNPCSNTYNLGWRNHPNFSWKDNQNNFIPQFQQPEKSTSLEDSISKFMERTEQFMNKTETNFQNQGAVIKNLETQMGQMAITLSGRAPSTLPSNTEVNPKDHVKAITTRSRVQLPEIHVKRSVANKEMVTSTDEEHVEQTEQTTAMKESSGTPQVKATIRIKAYDPPIPFP
ncbi:Uncharacterized protein Adt_31013 [Abeliophyllum distichum]|uniref:Reverse transcriptase domain-containing protein n=1 Tax=Abeliophyllum distichum TaxID=126358 RepID=A0ABD1RCW2_9LAMI